MFRRMGMVYILDGGYVVDLEEDGRIDSEEFCPSIWTSSSSCFFFVNTIFVHHIGSPWFTIWFTLAFLNNSPWLVVSRVRLCLHPSAASARTRAAPRTSGQAMGDESIDDDDDDAAAKERELVDAGFAAMMLLYQTERVAVR